jgi:hypothetical protein
MGTIPAQIADDLAPGTVHLGARVVEVAGTSVRLADGRVVSGRTVVVATDGPTASRLLGLAPVGSKRVGCVWFDAPAPPTRRRTIVIDGSRSGPVLNVAVMSNVAPGYAPPGRHLVAAAIPDPPDELFADVAGSGLGGASWEAAARTQLRGWWGAEVEGWRHLRTDVIAHGQPDQSPPFHPRERVSLGGGVFVCGDHRDTASIQGALFSGRRCAEAVASATA